MADKTKIEWADATLNYINGCSVVSPGCTNCYAMRLAGTRMKHHPTRAGLTQESKAGPIWTGEVRAHEPALLQALRWKAPRRIFWNAHGDTFHDQVPDEWIDRMVAICALTPQHTHLILTKRSARMRAYFNDPDTNDRIYDLVCNWAIESLGQVVLIAPGFPPEMAPDGRHVPLGLWPLPNVWLGVSVEDQARAVERIPDLLAAPAVVRWISAEPLLAEVDLRRWMWGWHPTDPIEMDRDDAACEGARIDQVVVGGESGPGARPMHPDWARSLRDQCVAAGVSFFFKQWGDWISAEGWYADYHASLPCRAWNGENWTDCGSARGEWVARIGKKKAGRLLDGREWNEAPR